MNTFNPHQGAMSARTALVSLLLAAVGSTAWDPVPPCPAPFPNAAVPETWCSSVVATNASSGVTVAQFGLPSSATLVTVATNASLWYDEAIFSEFGGGGIAGVFEYMAGANSRNKSIIGRARADGPFHHPARGPQPLLVAPRATG